MNIIFALILMAAGLLFVTFGLTGGTDFHIGFGILSFGQAFNILAIDSTKGGR